MGFDFDESGRNEEYDAEDGEPTGEPEVLGKQPPPRPAPVAAAPVVTGSMEQIVANLLSPTVAPTVAEVVKQADDSYMQEVDLRLEVASYYRMLLNGDLFGNPSQAGRIVEHELRAWVRERLGDLVNVHAAGKPKVQQQLTDAEVEVVRALADLSREQILGLKLVADKFRNMGTSPVPTLRSAPTPAPVQQATPQAPTLIKRQGPTSPQPAAPQQAPEPHRRPGPGRPPKNKPVTYRERRVVHPLGDGTTAEITVKDQRVQRPAGMLPMPATNLQMEAATAMQSAKQAASIQSSELVVKAITAINNTPTE